MNVALDMISFGSWVLDFFKTSRGQWFFYECRCRCRFRHLQAAHSVCAHPLPSPPQRLQWTRRGHTCQHARQTPGSTQTWSILQSGPDACSPPSYDGNMMACYGNTVWHWLVHERKQWSNSQNLGKGKRKHRAVQAGKLLVLSHERLSIAAPSV